MWKALVSTHSVGGSCRRWNRERLNLVSPDMDDAVLILQLPCNPQELLPGDQYPVCFIELGMDDHVRDPGLILKRKEDEAERRPWPLPRDYATSCTDLCSVLSLQQLLCRQDAALPQLGTAVGERMWGLWSSRFLRSQPLAVPRRSFAAAGLFPEPRPRPLFRSSGPTGRLTCSTCHMASRL